MDWKNGFTSNQIQIVSFSRCKYVLGTLKYAKVSKCGQRGQKYKIDNFESILPFGSLQLHCWTEKSNYTVTIIQKMYFVWQI